jgi:hypothetical protein
VSKNPAPIKGIVTPVQLHRQAESGFSLVELLLTLAMLGTVMLAITNMLIKGSAISATMDARYKEAAEVHAVIQDLMQDLAQGVYISPNSHKQRLEYTTYDTSSSAVKEVYAICYATANASSTDTACAVNSGSNTTPYLKYSTDGGATWGSPYRLSAYNKYKLIGTPIFLYAQDANNCTSFTDTDANGVWLSGTDSAGVFADCGAYDTSSPILTSPTQATKVVLQSFAFTTGSGVPEAIRNLPTNIFMAAPQGVVVSTSAAVSPGVKDSQLFHSFDVKTANSLFNTTFALYSLRWDPVRQRLLAAGRNSDVSGAVLYQVDRTGVLIGPPIPISAQTSAPSVLPVGMALLEDGETLVVADSLNNRIKWFNINSSPPLNPFKSLAVSTLSQDPYGMAYDPRYPNEIFVYGGYPNGTYNYKIEEIDTTAGALATNVIPGGVLTLTGDPDTYGINDLTLEPLTGDFLATVAHIYGSAPNRTIRIYRIPVSGSQSYVEFNIDALGNSSTSINWFSAYDPETNHFFLYDPGQGKIHEVIPDKVITARQ